MMIPSFMALQDVAVPLPKSTLGPDPCPAARPLHHPHFAMPLLSCTAAEAGEMDGVLLGGDIDVRDSFSGAVSTVNSMSGEADLFMLLRTCWRTPPLPPTPQER